LVDIILRLLERDRKGNFPWGRKPQLAKLLNSSEKKKKRVRGKESTPLVISQR